MAGWLTSHALPEYRPEALRRARSEHFTDPSLLSREERSAQGLLDELEQRHAAERTELEGTLAVTRERGDRIRNGLLYGTGADLVAAVADLLNSAGLQVLDLDAELGTRSADLLVSNGQGAARLVEVKAESGPAKENLVNDVQRHLSTWPQLQSKRAVDGGVLIVNHQHRQAPSDRPVNVYARAEFVAALTVPVLSTWQPFQWWADDDLVAIRAAVLPPAPASGTSATDGATAAAPSPDTPTDGGPDPSAMRRRRWSWRRG